MVDTQDTAGPMTRNVTDAAILLDALSARDADDPAIRRAARAESYQHSALDADGLRGKRVGVVRLRGEMSEGDDEMLNTALEVLVRCGALLVHAQVQPHGPLLALGTEPGLDARGHGHDRGHRVAVARSTHG